MHVGTRIRKGVPVLLGVVALVAAMSPLSSVGHFAKAATPHYLTLVDRQAPIWTRNFNPFLSTGTAAEWSKGGIYEPLMIFAQNPQASVYPWLATSYSWTNGNKTLLVNLRQNVLWSDG